MILLGKYSLTDLQECYERVELGTIEKRLKPFYKPGSLFPILSSNDPMKFTVGSYGFPSSRSNDLILSANAETVIRTRPFMKPIRKQWCLIPVSGIVMDNDRGKKNAVWLHGKRVFSLAGIWELFEDQSSGVAVNHFALITIPANKFLLKLGINRMPLLFTKEYHHRWLRKRDLNGVTSLFQSLPDQLFNAVEVKVQEDAIQALKRPFRSKSYFRPPELPKQKGYYSSRYERMQRMHYIINEKG